MESRGYSALDVFHGTSRGCRFERDLFDHIQIAYENKAKPAMDHDESNDDTMMTDVVPTWPLHDDDETKLRTLCQPCTPLKVTSINACTTPR